MKKILFAAFLAATASAALSAEVGVSVSIGQPGFFGQIDIGGYPPPRVIYQQPRAIYRVPIDREPVYLRVPPGHSKNWRKYCGRYNACDERVYFVQDNWYRREYAPQYQQRHFDGRYDRRDEQRHEQRNEQRNDHRQDERNNHRDEGRNHDKNR